MSLRMQKNGSKLQWFPPCPRHVDSIKIKQNHAWHNGIKFYLMKYLFFYTFRFQKKFLKYLCPESDELKNVSRQYSCLKIKHGTKGWYFQATVLSWHIFLIHCFQGIKIYKILVKTKSIKAKNKIKQNHAWHNGVKFSFLFSCNCDLMIYFLNVTLSWHKFLLKM